MSMGCGEKRISFLNFMSLKVMMVAEIFPAINNTVFNLSLVARFKFN
ncbi:unnamed protein product [Arabidopsis thaliana]|uniref:Transmembrane protein n=2 Tax=Arabidopsis thaliana TaxID=3702 RepID=A0A654FMB8_ARATH|nr:uncharacterized protein AT4G08406 [Arabidopsis thaliana]AEE82640.1 transmembrane protein [Arabidopsis thaliana]CAA0394100.1 unnamed protein product [Arabidopsis thaliana]VYS62002.1 unnamed protein product [Arabidopsis thaliana]|eukprot:NP_001118950.1 transmembrane protein [Arabidopsis thaliana]